MPIKNSPLPKAKVQHSETANNAAPLTATTIRKKRSGGKQPKHHARKDRVTTMMRRAKILEAAIEGKDITKAAIEAGLSPKSAGQQASQILNSPLAQRTFKMILAERGVSDEFLAQKIRSLLDAKQTVFFQKDGEVRDQREVEAIETQRKTCELVAKLKGHLREQSQIDLNIGIMAMVVSAVRGDDGEDLG
jgi:intergrase/recombinase